jgi:hypothetical protein
MAGVDTIRGVAFQLAQTLSDIVELVADGSGDAVVIEGAADIVDYEVLNGAGRSIAVRQAKTRREPASWGATELSRILCAWGDADYSGEAEFAFVTDASLNDSGQRLNELVKAMRLHPDEDVLRRTAESLGRGGIQLPSMDVVRRVQILSRMGTTDSVLAKVEMRVLTLLSRARLTTPDDATNAVNALLRRVFVVGGDIDLRRRTVSRTDVLHALGLDESNLRGAVAWSMDTADEYRAVVAEDSRRVRGFVPLNVALARPVPHVLRLMTEPAHAGGTVESLDVVLTEQTAVLVGAAGQGKSTALRYLAARPVERGLIPVMLQAAGHVPGSLPRRVRNAIEVLLGRSLTAGAVQHLLALPELLLLIDGVSEVDSDTRAGLSSDLGQLAAQCPVRLIAAGRDLPLTIAGAAMPDIASVFRLTSLDSGSRRLLADAHGSHEQVVRMIEHQLGDIVENPLLFLMALSLSRDDGVPDTRAEVYQQFLRGLVIRARVSDDDVSVTALGRAWAQMIGRDLRAADHYTWRSALGAALDELGGRSAWRGHTSDAGTALEIAQRIGLLARADLDGGLEPLHDSFADFLAARTIVRGEAELPDQLNTGFDESVLFMVEMAGLDDALALRLAAENPLLACRVAQQRRARGRSEAEQVGRLLRALAAGRELPALSLTGLRLCHHDQFIGAVLAGDGYETVEIAQFDMLTREKPAFIVPAWTGSLQLAVRIWAAAVNRAHRPNVRVFQPVPPADAEQAPRLLVAYLRETEDEVHRLINSSLPGPVGNRVLAAIGPQSVIAWIGDPVPGHLGGLDVPLRYRRGTEYVATRGQPPPDAGPLGHDTVARMMRRHPVNQAAYEIRQALSVLTADAWPES